MSPALQPQSPFTGLRFASPGGGVLAEDRHDVAIVRVVSRLGATDALSRRIREQIGVELPRRPIRAEAEDVAFVGLGVDSWLATTEAHHDEFAASLQQVTGDLGAVSDQTGAYGLLRVSGPRVREALAKLVGIDLHPRNFPAGAAASTSAGHIAIVLWRLADDAGSARFELAVQRSFAPDFWNALAASAAEFGFSFSPWRP